MIELATAQTPASAYRISTTAFEGPLDLLLHLIRRDQINIYNIPIAEICSRYFETLKLLEQPNVTLAGEFFVMAGVLLHLKSQMLLPVEGIESEEDPRKPLVQKLLEYERFKKMAPQLDGLPWLYRDIYPHSPAALHDILPVEIRADAPIEGVDPFQLLLCLNIAKQRTTKPPLDISVDKVSIRDRVVSMTPFFDKRATVEFFEVLGENPLRRDVVITFLAMLELARLQYVKLHQTSNCGPILIEKLRQFDDFNFSALEQFA